MLGRIDLIHLDTAPLIPNTVYFYFGLKLFFSLKPDYCMFWGNNRIFDFDQLNGHTI